ncbi:MAG: hypothetical protein ACKVPX_09850 [Myxococcaceae bacterium]
MTETPPDDPYAPDPDSRDETREGPVRGFVTDFVRKAAAAGLGAFFLTEEGVRNLAGQLKVPKELLGFVTSQAERTKEEVARVLAEELRQFLSSQSVRDEVVKLLKGMTLEVKAEIRLVPSKDPTSAPQLRVETQAARPAKKRPADV